MISSNCPRLTIYAELHTLSRKWHQVPGCLSPPQPWSLPSIRGETRKPRLQDFLISSCSVIAGISSERRLCRVAARIVSTRFTCQMVARERKRFVRDVEHRVANIMIREIIGIMSLPRRVRQWKERKKKEKKGTQGWQLHQRRKPFNSNSRRRTPFHRFHGTAMHEIDPR